MYPIFLCIENKHVCSGGDILRIEYVFDSLTKLGIISSVPITLNDTFIVMYVMLMSQNQSDVTWAPWCLKSTVTKMIVQQIVLDDHKENTKYQHYCFSVGNPPVTDEFSSWANYVQSISMSWHYHSLNFWNASFEYTLWLNYHKWTKLGIIPSIPATFTDHS